VNEVNPWVYNRVRTRSTRRIGVVWGIVTLLIVLMLVPVGNLQIVEHGKWKGISNGQVHHTITVPALRGGMYDRYGAVLAVSRPTYRVIANNFQIDHPRTTAEQISQWVRIPVPRLTKMLKRKSGYVVLTNSMSVNDGRDLQRLNLPGLVIEQSTDRSSPNGMLARSLVGYINASGSGSAGLETQYESLLAGQAGEAEGLTNQSGLALPGSSTRVIKKAKAGMSLELTIDSALQFVTEQTLAKQLRVTGGYSGVAIVMDVRTGEILADASLVNHAVEAGALTPVTDWGTSIGVPEIRQTIMNLGITQVYLPGSVFKVVPFSAALQSGVVSPTTRFQVPYSTRVGTRLFHDAEHHGVLNLSTTEVLSQSSNIGTYLIARQVGKEGLLSQVSQMGFGHMTSLAYPGESSGLLKTTETWSASDMVALPIGQVNAVTPLQVLDAYNAIANNGVFVQPKLVRALINPDGTIRATASSKKHRVLSTAIAAQLNAMLQKVVSVGTGTAAFVPGYLVAGKTGTSQIASRNTASFIAGAYNATFVGFAPADHPILSTIVVIQRPRTSIFGGVISAPVFQRIMAYALHHYNIPLTAKSGQKITPGSTSFHSDVT
jgi:cell division protein FtsI (penicillin-binding protein 3)